MHARFLIYHWGVWGCYRRAVLSQSPSSFSYLMSPHFLPRYEGHQLINQNVLSEQRDLCSFAGHLIWTGWCGGWWPSSSVAHLPIAWIMQVSYMLSFSCTALERIIHKMILSNLIFFPLGFIWITKFLLWKHFLNKLDIIISQFT